MRPDDAPLPRPSLSETALGALRVATVLALVAAGAAYVLAVGAGGRHERALRAAQRLCRLFCRVTGVALRTPHADRLARHPGFVFFNHGSFLDVVVLLAAAPMRFLATAGVRRLPFVGRMADAAGTLYVARGNAASREAARRALRATLRRAPLPPGGGGPPGAPPPPGAPR
ncbi:MAG: lysophospholipid acyltransferase family protein, partial [Rubricoccaceae bacterium]